ncbi:MAG: hypothetical protein AAGM36_07760 [Cyanobacteria bacterium J06597_1]
MIGNFGMAIAALERRRTDATPMLYECLGIAVMRETHIPDE